MSTEHDEPDRPASAGPDDNVTDISSARRGKKKTTSEAKNDAASGKNDDGDNDDGESKKKGPSQATVILQLLRERYRPLLGDDGQTYAVSKFGANVALQLRGTGGLRSQAAKLYADATKGTVPGGSALTDAITVFAGLAEQCDPERIYLRVARPDDRTIVIDQGTADGRCIIVDQDGWRCASRSPVLFRRTRLSAPMPDPCGPGSLDAFRKLINADDDDWQVIVGFLIAAFFEDIPHPILGLFGLQGTAKTNATRMLINLVSPSTAPTRSSPRDLKTWVTGANAAWVTGLDNLSAIPDWLSDALCRASTGEGMVDRALYTDADVSVIAFRRVAIINGIDTGEMAGDLTERLIRVELNPITKRRDERALWADFDEARPFALAALLDMLSRVLKVLPGIEVKDAPRMADFAKILAAVDEIQGDGWDSLGHYVSVSKEAQSESLSPFGLKLRDFALDECKNGAKWSGTASTLWDALVPTDTSGKPKPPKDWPKPQTLKGRIKRDMPALATFGIDVDFNQKTPDKKRDRLIVLTYDPAANTKKDTGSEGKRNKPSGASGASGTAFDQPELPDNMPDNPATPDSSSCPVTGDRTAPDNPPDNSNGQAVRSPQSRDQPVNVPPDGPDAPDSFLRLPPKDDVDDGSAHEPDATATERGWPAHETGNCSRCRKPCHRYGVGASSLCRDCQSTQASA